MGLFATKQEKLDKKFLKACESGTPEEISALLEQGANVNAVSKRGTSQYSDRIYKETGLHIALRTKRWEIVHLLIDKKCDVNATAGYNNNTAVLETAINYCPGHEDIVVCLVRLGAKLSALRSYGGVLHLAAIHRRARMIELLIEQKLGGDINARDDYDGNTALHEAAERGDFNCVKALVEGGADVEVLNNRAETPALRAQKIGHAGIAEYLRKQEAPQLPVVEVSKAGWELTAPDEVALVEEKAVIGCSITHIFNFTNRVCIRLARDLRTGAQSQTERFFDEFPNKQEIEAAFAELKKKNGTAPVSAIFGKVLKK